MLGVSESTVRRWCDDDRIPAIRTHGKHRRIDRRALLAFARREGLAVSPGSVAAAGRGGRLASMEELADRLFGALIRGDTASARQLAVGVIDHAVAPAVLCDEVIAAAMVRVGDEWARGKVHIYEEHAATQAALAAVAAVRAMLSRTRRGAPVAVCAGLSSDPYALGPAMAALVLQAAGFDAILFGPDTPAAQLRLSIDGHRPRVVALSIGAVDDPVRLVGDVASINEQAASSNTAVVIGGQRLDGDLRARLRAHHFGDNMKHLADLAARIADETAEKK